jgi:hypothetical protein
MLESRPRRGYHRCSGSCCQRYWRSVSPLACHDNGTDDRFIFAPSIDGDLIPSSPHTLLEQGKFARIPFISGNVKDEYVSAYILKGVADMQGYPVYSYGHQQRDRRSCPLTSSFACRSTPRHLAKCYLDVPHGSFCWIVCPLSLCYKANVRPFDTGNETFGLEPA